MAWDDPYETFVGATGELYVGAVGTSFPSGFDTPGASWTGLGYTSEDGAGYSYSQDIEELRAWQSANPIRRVKTAETFSIAAALLQWNESTVPAAFGGGTVSSVTGGYQYAPPGPSDSLAEKAAILDVSDGSRSLRIMVARATVADTSDSSFVRNAFAELPIALNALKPDSGDLFNIRFSDTAAFAAGS